MSNTFALAEVLDYSVFEFSSTGYGDVLFFVDYATKANIITESSRLEIRGGQGNYKILDIDHTKNCTFDSSLPLIDLNALAVKLGRKVTEGARSVPHQEIKSVKTVLTDLKVTLSNTPVANTLKVYRLNYERDLGVEIKSGNIAGGNNLYSLTGDTLTFSSDVTAGTMLIFFYEYTSSANTKNIKITANDFPTFITITGRGIVDDDQAGKRIPVTFKIHKAKVQTGFELTAESTAATEIDFNCDCYTIINSDGDREYVDINKIDPASS